MWTTWGEYVHNGREAPQVSELLPTNPQNRINPNESLPEGVAVSR
jgi:hypothetical protein